MFCQITPQVLREAAYRKGEDPLNHKGFLLSQAAGRIEELEQLTRSQDLENKSLVKMINKIIDGGDVPFTHIGLMAYKEREKRDV